MAGCNIQPINGVLPDTVVKSFDPIQGLVDFTLDVKPYHTKIVQVLVEYIYTDEINATIDERLEWVITALFPGQDCRYWFDTSTDILYHRVSYTVQDFDIIGINAASNYFTISGNYGGFFSTGGSFEVDGTQGDDGFYYVASTVYNVGPNTTDIYVVEDIASSVVSGIVRLITPSIYADWVEIPVTISLTDPALSSTVYSGDYWFVLDPVAEVRLYVRNTDNTEWIALDVVIIGTDPRTQICGIENAICDYGYGEVPFGGTLGAPIAFDVVSIDGTENKFVVNGNQLSYFPPGQPFDLKFSSANNGIFTTLVSHYNSSTTQTTIWVHEDVDVVGSPHISGQIITDDNVLPIITFAQPTAPTATAIGQLWWEVEFTGSPQEPILPVYGSPLTGSPFTGSPKTVPGTNVFRWDGSAWVLYHPYGLGYDLSAGCTVLNPPRAIRAVFAERLEFKYLDAGIGSPEGVESGIYLEFFDTIGVTITKDVEESQITTGNSMLPGSLDAGYWDIGAFDESFDTVHELIGNSFAP